MTQRLTQERFNEIWFNEICDMELPKGRAVTAIAELLDEVVALRAELAGAEERGRQNERAAVAAWMPLQMERFDDEAGYAIETLAADIADGDHVRAGTTPPDAGDGSP